MSYPVYQNCKGFVYLLKVLSDMIPIFNNNINDQVPITLYYIHGSTSSYHYFHADNHRNSFFFPPRFTHVSTLVETKSNETQKNQSDD